MIFAIAVLLRGLALGILMVSLCVPIHAQEAGTAVTAPVVAHELAHRFALPGLGNFAQVTPFLYRGAQPSELGFATLAKMGVGIVVDLRGDRDNEREQVAKLGMQYVAIPSQCSRMNDEGVAKFLTILRNNPDKKVFVHCRYDGRRLSNLAARLDGRRITARDGIVRLLV